MKATALVVLALAAPDAALAQAWGDGAPETARFEQCLPDQMQAFDTALRGPGYGADWMRGAMNVYWVQHCGYLAMGICDVSDNAVRCQRRLRAAFDVLARDVRALLPEPEGVAGELAPLYAQLRALAFGTSAGDDCAGWDVRRGLWCDSFQAVLSVEAAVHAWQVARLMGVVGPLDWVALAELEGE